MSWNPLVVAVPFGWFVTRVSISGFTPFRVVGLCGTGLWFVLAMIDLWTKHQLTDWIYADDDP